MLTVYWMTFPARKEQGRGEVIISQKKGAYGAVDARLGGLRSGSPGAYAPGYHVLPAGAGWRIVTHSVRPWRQKQDQTNEKHPIRFKQDRVQNPENSIGRRTLLSIY